MNAQELVKLCDAAEDDRDCYAEHIIIRQGCSSCEAYLAREPAKARRKLELAGFSLLARARQYATMLEALGELLNEVEYHEKEGHIGISVAANDARDVLATEVKS